ncbi:2-dehydro-3-deoxygalactonokinase [Dyadobacter psychrophilus]|uniref:2-dehydro-3-deoxygalactonokinase n=1 Tax=Dyadobacter psychrophilus TaxID=651661 RepID=A0A1T5DJP6_9BACT|nr:2-dehydro-3-deoxygalactonokinase [Dyadobacter psychrophilus]SKB71700.1 2-dehydro-3-deoxygalactonokinase [Dyadobacter psychrophilus]
MNKYLLCCDWGTTSFRLQLINRGDQRLIAEQISQNGIGQTYDIWKQREQSGIERITFFKEQLKNQIDALSIKAGFSLDNITILMSGMASSSIGMQEIPYAQLPFALDGSDVLIKYHEADETLPNDIMLFSGVRSSRDVMRGEETQLIGLAEMIDLSMDIDAIFILPGTHSKHLYIEKGVLVDFKTYMTGEVFNVMANYSILKDSVTAGLGTQITASEWKAFEDGIRESEYSEILNALFTVRTRQLFDLLDKKQNAMYLSGILIGSELRQLNRETNWQLILCCGQNLHALYQKAIETLQLSKSTIIVPSETVDNAASAGQIRIFEFQNLLLNKINL